MSFIQDFKESNRWKHFLYAIPVGFLFTILCALGIAAGLEFKDTQYGNTWDWKDFGFTVLGGAVGQIIQLILIFIIW